jgi:hypothetical protein
MATLKFSSVYIFETIDEQVIELLQTIAERAGESEVSVRWANENEDRAPILDVYTIDGEYLESLDTAVSFNFVK